MATAKPAGSRPRSASTLHHAIASVRSARGSTPTNFHSLLARSAWSLCGDPFRLGVPASMPRRRRLRLEKNCQPGTSAWFRSPGERGR
jgi:hypothetical protein